MKPILFNTEMVRAILDGRKSVTRRVVKLKYSNTHLEMFTNKYGTRLVEMQNEEPGVTTIKNPDGTTTHKLLACIEKEPPYHPGDILYVRETWEECEDTGGYLYRAWPKFEPKDEDDAMKRLGLKWRPSIHMPKEAARLFLRVTNVRVERLQDITGEEALKEGVVSKRPYFMYETVGQLEVYARNKFGEIWDSTIKKDDLFRCGWEANPWVWVIGFERISKEEALENA